MPAFNYKALNEYGKTTQGVLEADGPRLVRQQLRDRGMVPISVELSTSTEKKQGAQLFKGRPLKVQELALITRQLATLIQAGIPVEQALSAVVAQTEKPRTRSILSAVRAKVVEGYTLADSLAAFPKAFPRLYRSTVAAGEHAGHLDLVLNRLADHTEQRQEARQKIQLATIYPVILTVVAVSIVVFLVSYVVPDIIDVFIKQGQSLPPLTSTLLAMSDFLSAWGIYLLALMAASLVGFRIWLNRPAFRRMVHKRLLNARGIRGLVRGYNTARYASTLSILTSSGVPLVEAMRISGEVLGNDHLRERLASAAKTVSEGGSLNKALTQAGYFPPMMLHMIASGETSGELDDMLERTARMQENTLQAKVETLVGLFEPIMLLVMGAVVLIIVLAIMLPILNMSNLVG